MLCVMLYIGKCVVCHVVYQFCSWPMRYIDNRRRDIRLTMLLKIINEIANVANKDIPVTVDTTTRNIHGHK